MTYLNCEIQSKDAEDNEKYSTIGERTDYLNNVLNDGNKPSALMLFFVDYLKRWEGIIFKALLD